MMGKQPSREHYVNVCKVECAIWGVDFDLTIGNARWRPATYVRSRVAKHFLALGYGLAATARTMGMHHTAVLHNLRRPDDLEIAFLELGPAGWDVWRDGAPAPQPPLPARKITHRWLREPGDSSEVIT